MLFFKAMVSPLRTLVARWDVSLRHVHYPNAHLTNFEQQRRRRNSSSFKSEFGQQLQTNLSPKFQSSQYGAGQRPLVYPEETSETDKRSHSNKVVNYKNLIPPETLPSRIPQQTMHTLSFTDYLHTLLSLDDRFDATIALLEHISIQHK